MDRQQLVRRHISSVVLEAVNDSAIVVLSGARQVGKTTLTQSFDTRPTRYLTCDDPATLAACKQDPVGFLDAQNDTLTIIDEVQRAPELILPLKMKVDATGQRSGQFLLTGSVDIFGTGHAPDSLAGRVDLIRVHPLSVGEKQGRPEPEDFVEWLQSISTPPPTGLDSPETQIVELITTGGYPALPGRTARSVSRWMNSYLTLVTDHRVTEVLGVRAPERVRSLVRYLSQNPASEVNWSKVAAALGIPGSSIQDVAQQAERLFLTHTLPGWGPSVGGVKKAKVSTIDTGLAAHSAGFNPGQENLVGRRECFGQLVEQLVVEELSKQATWSRLRYSLHHFRSKHGLEVDCVIELADGTVMPTEIKATRSPTQQSWKNLTQFREKYRERVNKAVLFHLGDKSFCLDGWLYVLPVSALWQHPS